ncbi:hypothetical protein BsWGS_07803 [Bradybaena similaris]
MCSSCYSFHSQSSTPIVAVKLFPQWPFHPSSNCPLLFTAYKFYSSSVSQSISVLLIISVPQHISSTHHQCPTAYQFYSSSMSQFWEPLKPNYLTNTCISRTVNPYKFLAFGDATYSGHSAILYLS